MPRLNKDEIAKLVNTFDAELTDTKITVTGMITSLTQTQSEGKNLNYVSIKCISSEGEIYYSANIDNVLKTYKAKKKTLPKLYDIVEVGGYLSVKEAKDKEGNPIIKDNQQLLNYKIGAVFKFKVIKEHEEVEVEIG